jgi:hypothetical protein
MSSSSELPPIPQISILQRPWKGHRVVGSHQIHFIDEDANTDNFSPMAAPTASVQYYIKPHKNTSVVLHEPWSVYKAVHFKDGPVFKVAILQLEVPAGAVVIISNCASEPHCGLAYRCRVALATVKRLFKVTFPLEPDMSSAVLHEQCHFPAVHMPDAEDDLTDTLPNRHLVVAGGKFCLNPTMADGAGIDVQPTLNETAKVAIWLWNLGVHAGVPQED